MQKTDIGIFYWPRCSTNCESVRNSDLSVCPVQIVQTHCHNIYSFRTCNFQIYFPILKQINLSLWRPTDGLRKSFLYVTDAQEQNLLRLHTKQGLLNAQMAHQKQLLAFVTQNYLISRTRGCTKSIEARIRTDWEKFKELLPLLPTIEFSFRVEGRIVCMVFVLELVIQHGRKRDIGLKG